MLNKNKKIKMKKNIVVVLITFSITFFLVNNLAAQMKFEEGKWEDIVKKAKKDKKYIFVDAYAEWCGPCKAMAKNVFTDASVGNYFNEKYINYKFDMEKGEGPDFAKLHGVQAYPTLLFFNTDGVLAHRAVGGREVDGFISLGKNALDPDKQILSLENKFQKGEKSKEFMKKYLDALQEAGDEEKIPAVASQYLKDIPEKKWLEEENGSYLLQASKNNPKILDMFIENRNKIMKWESGANLYNNLIFTTLTNDITAIFQNKDSVRYEQFKKDNLKKFVIDGKKINARLDAIYAQYVTGKGFEEKLDIYANQYCDDWLEMSQLANMFAQGEDKAVLEKALKYAEKGEKLWKNPTTLYTSANILKKLNKKEEAKKKANEGVELAKKTKHESLKNLETLLAELNKK